MKNVEFNADGIVVNGEFISLEEIIKKVHSKRNIGNKCLMTIEWRGDRHFNGAKESVVIDYDKAVRFKEIIVKSKLTISLGEIAGKFSDVRGTLEFSEIRLSKEDVSEFLIKNPKGYEVNHSFLIAVVEKLDSLEYNGKDAPMSVGEFNDIFSDYTKRFGYLSKR